MPGPGRRVPRVDVCLGATALAAALVDDARSGLLAVPKVLSPKWLYDERGSQLFEQITALPEYYPTRREHEILVARAAKIARLSGADTLVELGSGTSAKTRLLLDALAAAGTLRRFVPFDLSETTLRAAAADIAEEYPALAVHAVVGDFERHLAMLPGGARRLIAFLGGTIGNLEPEPRAKFLADLASGMVPGDAFLLGTDLVKDVGRLRAAYDDAAGITAAFNKNVLLVLNRLLGARFEPDRFQHVARYDEERASIEMALRSIGAQRVPVAALGVDVVFEDGEEMRTEVSAKFRRPQVEAELAGAGLQLLAWWTDAAGDFALSLSGR